MDRYCLIVFKNTMDAIKGEEILKGENLKIVIMPTPTYITQSCGISIKFDEEDLEKINKLVEEEILKPKNIYIKDGEKLKTLM